MAQIVSRDSRGLPVVEFMDAAQFAPRFPLFTPIATALEEINRDIVTKGGNTALAQKIDAESYQINDREARLIVAMFGDPFKQKPLLLKRFAIDNDLVLGEPALVSIFHVPKTYWKLVIVTHISAATANATAITRSLMIALVLFILLPLVLAFLLIGRYIIRPLGGMTRSLKTGAETETDRLPLLEVKSGNELGEIA